MLSSFPPCPLVEIIIKNTMVLQGSQIRPKLQEIANLGFFSGLHELCRFAIVFFQKMLSLEQNLSRISVLFKLGMGLETDELGAKLSTIKF
jgi:hypothetical protein